MKTLILSITLILISTVVSAQQEGHFINQNNNPYMLNPAAGGMNEVLHFELTSRTQRLGYNGGPRSILVTGNSPIYVKGKRNAVQEFNLKDETLFESPERSHGELKHVVGGKVLTDAIGPFNRTAVNGSYAIHMPLVKQINIGVGLGIGWSNFAINADRVVLYQADDAAYNQFLGNSASQGIFDANAGIVAYNEDFFVGLSSSQIFKTEASFAGINTGSHFNRHYYLMGKYTLPFTDMLDFEPMITARIAEHTPGDLDIGARFVYDKSIFFAFQYRTANALTFQVGANLIKNLYLNYGYEQAVGSIQTSSNGTHEIQLGMYLGKKPKNQEGIKRKGKQKRGIIIFAPIIT